MLPGFRNISRIIYNHRPAFGQLPRSGRHLDEIVGINPGFVYKLVEYTSNGERIFPVKKACGKGNYPGLKRVVCSDKVLLKDGFGFEGLDLIKEDMEVVYDF